MDQQTEVLIFVKVFCASIPIVLEKLFSQKLVKENDKIILLGYGGGLNLGSILLEL